MLGVALLALPTVTLLWLMGPSYIPRRRAHPQVLRGHRQDLEAALRQATRSAKEAAECRTAAKANVHRLQDYAWSAAFHADNPQRAEAMLRTMPQVQRNIDAGVRRAAELDKVVAQALQQARTAKRALAKADPAPRQPHDLVVLARLCWKGWLASRRKRVLY